MKRRLLYLVFMLSMILTACQNASKDESVQPKEGEIPIYYLNVNEYKIVPYYVVVDDDTVEQRVQRVIDYLRNAPEGYKNVFSEKTTFQNYTVSEDGVINMYFSADYSSVNIVRENMCRIAVVKSLNGIEGVTGVRYYVAEQPLMDSTGVEVGIMDEFSFEDTLFQKINDIEVTLYFTDETGKILIPEKRTVKYAVDEGDVFYVVKALIDGPEKSELKPIVNNTVELTDAIVKEGVCYLYFTQSFMNNSLDVANSIPIYAIVNTVSELQGINRVQFVIDGKSDVIFRNQISLANTFSSNLDLIQK